MLPCSSKMLLRSTEHKGPPSNILLSSFLHRASSSIFPPYVLRSARVGSFNNLQCNYLPTSFNSSRSSPMMESNQETLVGYLEVGIEAARKAGQIILSNFYKSKTVEHKGTVDLVTETDKECEDSIFQHLQQHFPTHKFIGEETAAVLGKWELTDGPTWIVDPLDGTTNFVHGYPFVCVSIGLTIGKAPVVGVVFNPILNELFTAVKGNGAYLNGERITVSHQDQIVKALLATEVGTKRDKGTVDVTTNRLNHLLFKVRSLRMGGSCALNLCGIACGRLDLFYELGFGGPWDIAAGVLMVEEAGGSVFDPSGEPWNLVSQRIAASNPFLKQDLVDALKITGV